MNLFREAGLVADGKPVLPASPEEFHAQAAQFRQRTGKAYLIQVTNKDFAGPMRIFYAGCCGSVPLFGDARHANFDSPESRRALEFAKALYQRGDSARNLDYAGAVSAFPEGEGGVMVDGTWMVGQVRCRLQQRGEPLYRGYAVRTFPLLFHGRSVALVDGHNWVMPRNTRRTGPERAAARRFLRYFAANDFQWARTGHFPAFRAVIDSAQWRQLPHRGDIAAITQIGEPLPKYVRRQSPSSSSWRKLPQRIQAQTRGPCAGRHATGRANEILQSY
jgi:multiple sugar transport system substrate-binding protein